MKMKSAKKKALLNRAKVGERQHDVAIVKPEKESELDGLVEEDSSEVYTNGDGLSIRIKEEPHAQEICEEHSGDASSCLDTKPDTVTSRSDDHHQEGHVKDERDSDRQAEYEFTGAAVKEESGSWIKEERDSEEEAEDADNIREDYGDGEEVYTGRRQFVKNTQYLGTWCLFFFG